MCKIVYAILAATLLTACSESLDALEQAKAASSPEEALRIVRKAKDEHCEPGARFCSIPDALHEAESTYFEASARAGSAPVLRDVFGRAGFAPLKAELRDAVLKTAETSKDPDLLVAAAFIYGNDGLGMINLAQQRAMFERAWNAGDKQSAGYLAHVFARAEDYERAYYWSLRCAIPCKRDMLWGIHREGLIDRGAQTQLAELEKHLSSAAIARHQRQAAAAPRAAK